MFAFLSGYGLVKKYERPGVQVKIGGFVAYRYLKLLRLMLLPLLAFHLIYAFYNFWTLATSWQNIVAQLLTVVNITAAPNPATAIFPGPFWFFGMIMEMYVIYRLVLYRPSTASRASHQLGSLPRSCMAVCMASNSSSRSIRAGMSICLLLLIDSISPSIARIL